ncbi:hypothetical protein PPTG_22657, partial [Phytophthora nicotianae INRA-310]
ECIVSPATDRAGATAERSLQVIVAQRQQQWTVCFKVLRQLAYVHVGTLSSDPDVTS